MKTKTRFTQHDQNRLELESKSNSELQAIADPQGYFLSDRTLENATTAQHILNERLARLEAGQ